MFKLLLLIGSIATTILSAPVPRYGEDGGYKGHASYKPITGLRSFARRAGAFSHGGYGGDVDVTQLKTQRGKGSQGRSIAGGYKQALSYSQGQDAVPKSYGALQYAQGDLHGYGSNKIADGYYNQAPNHVAQYGHNDGGYKVADAYQGQAAYKQGDQYGPKEDYAHQPQPYEYGYQLKDEHGNEQFKKESSDGHGNVQGTYGYKDEHGLYRQVDYVADKEGFRANVKTNEPGTDNQNPADVHIQAEHGPEHY